MFWYLVIQPRVIHFNLGCNILSGTSALALASNVLSKRWNSLSLSWNPSARAPPTQNKPAWLTSHSRNYKEQHEAAIGKKMTEMGSIAHHFLDIDMKSASNLATLNIQTLFFLSLHYQSYPFNRCFTPDHFHLQLQYLSWKYNWTYWAIWLSREVVHSFDCRTSNQDLEAVGPSPPSPLLPVSGMPWARCILEFSASLADTKKMRLGACRASTTLSSSIRKLRQRSMCCFRTWTQTPQLAQFTNMIMHQHLGLPVVCLTVVKQSHIQKDCMTW